jgi:hypothetical protein
MWPRRSDGGLIRHSGGRFAPFARCPRFLRFILFEVLLFEVVLFKAVLFKAVLFKVLRRATSAAWCTLPKHHATEDSDAEDIDPAERELQQIGIEYA